jgi:glycosyltransferase involved in cell wall biosynthesis
MDKPSVTVVIPTYNRAHFLAECLDSVFGQTLPPTQVIVINDGSTDNTREVLQPYMGKIEYLEKENGGKSAALNLGMTRVNGDYVWVMDDDDVAIPDAIESLVKVLLADSTVQFSYGLAHLASAPPEGGRLRVTGPYEPRPPMMEDDELFVRLLEYDFIPHDAALVRTCCYREVGPFDTELVRSQDYEMILRLARRYRGCGIKKPVVLVRVHAGMRGSARDRFQDHRSQSKWREYDVRIFARLRADLELWEYVPARLRARMRAPEMARAAYLQRMCVMARNQMGKETIEDLLLALRQPTADKPLSPREKANIRTAVDCVVLSSAGLNGKGGVVPAIRMLLQGRVGQEIQTEITRVLYWRATLSLKGGHLRRLAKDMVAAARLIGIRGVLGGGLRVGLEKAARLTQRKGAQDTLALR